MWRIILEVSCLFPSKKTQEVHSDAETGEISSDDDTGDEDDKVEQELLIESIVILEDGMNALSCSFL